MASVRKREWTHNGETKTAWVVTYTDQAGKRRLKTFDKKKDADKYRTQVEVEIERGEHVAGSASETVKACCDNFLRDADQWVKDGAISAARRDTYRCAVDGYIIPTLGDMKICELSRADIDEFHKHMASVANLAPISRRMYLTVFKQIEEHAESAGHTRKRVVRDYKIKAKSGSVNKIKTFGKDQIDAVLAALAAKPKRGRDKSHKMLQCVVLLAAFCGLRAGEIFGLTVGCVDFDGRIIKVRHSLTRRGELKGPKTASGNRDVPMPAPVFTVLMEWMDNHYADNARGLLFVSGLMRSFSDWREKNWHPLLKRAGLWSADGDQYHFHALRHFYASWLIQNGLSLADVAALLGHGSFDVTLQTYAHPVINDDHRHAAVHRIAAALLPPTRQGSDMGV